MSDDHTVQVSGDASTHTYDEGCAERKLTLKDLDAEKITWCPGCGNFGIFIAIKKAILNLGIDPSQFYFVYGIGCHGHMVNFLDVNGFEGLHGRAVPVAVGAKLANSRLKTIVITGDGDCLGEGLNHFVTAARGNQDITVVIHDNQVYGLTTGQTSPTSDKGFKSKSTPQGVIERPVNPLALALTSGATFVSAGFAGDIRQLQTLFEQALTHTGFSLLNVYQPCHTYNKVNTYDWFRDRVYKLDESTHDSSDFHNAVKLAYDPEKLATGVLFQAEHPSYEQDAKLTESIVGKGPNKEALGRLLENFK
ncbi:2-oxoacid:ferredoxin oxidoreductase subunit beta [Candidatus Woesearchaeota archaeon]|nr:2-oxoacid:ferredoxin oxidoreductase subunit beta [Candidatus Woesearchaeota archaeon]